MGHVSRIKNRFGERTPKISIVLLLLALITNHTERLEQVPVGESMPLAPERLVRRCVALSTRYACALVASTSLLS